MPTIKLPRESYQFALERAQLNPEENKAIEKLIGTGARTVNVTIDVDRLPKKYLAALLNEPALNANQRGMVAMRVHGVRGQKRHGWRYSRTRTNSRARHALISTVGPVPTGHSNQTAGRNRPYFFNRNPTRERGTRSHTDVLWNVIHH